MTEMMILALICVVVPALLVVIGAICAPILSSQISRERGEDDE